jgi:hypothetical protein
MKRSRRETKVVETTVVIFRMDRQGIVFALLPELPTDIHGVYCTCYEHVGQHSSADYHGCIASSRPATPTEYGDLLIELERRGYHVDARRRATPVMHERRRLGRDFRR